MTSEPISFTRLTCDRCGHSQDCHYAGDRAPWVTINAQHKDDSAGLPGTYKADLCPRCYESLNGWYRLKQPPIFPTRGPAQ